MVAKNASILVSIESEVKEQAEEILSKLGFSASVIINMLYKQIIMTKSILISVALPKDFNEVIENGLLQAKAN